MEHNKTKLNGNILKKLTAYELLFERMQKNGDWNVVRVFIMDSKIDLYQNKDIVEKSLNEWKSLHPLLRCHILDDPDDQYQSYFAYASNEKLNKNDNIKFLYYESDDKKENDYANCWKYLAEKELNEIYDSENELLWKLIFLKMDSNEENDLHKYCVLMANHHATTDGPNAYEIMIELLEIIENNYYGKTFEVNAERKLYSVYEYNYPNDPRVIECSLNGEVSDNEFSIESLPAPQFLKSSQKSKTKVTSNGRFYTMDNKEYASIQDIIKNRSKFHSEFKMFSFDKNTLTRLLSKCKKNNVKLTNCLDLIISSALRKVYKRYTTNSTDLVPIRNYLSINMRRFMNPIVDIRIMGLFLTGILLEYDKELEYGDNESLFWNKTFWEIARSKFDELYNHLQGKSFLKKETSIGIERFYLNTINKITTLPNTKSDILAELYVMSNIGPVASTPKGSNNFKINEYYSTLSFSKTNYFECSYCSTCTIDNRLYMCIAYNNCHFHEESVEYWIECINENILKLIQSD